MKKSIGLCMIVKNEAKVIRRCLDSVMPLIDYVCIVDTGSTDGTQAIIKQYLNEKNLIGEVFDEPWQNFAYNRTFALAKLRERQDVDYALMIDADSIITYTKHFNAETFKNGLEADVYDVNLRLGSIIYHLPLLTSNKLSFNYKGVLHEYLELGDGKSRKAAEGFFNDHIQDSARNTNPKKYLDDALVFENALRTETDPFLISRYTFYLAQSYRDCGEKGKSLEAYQRRTTMGYWDQEIFYSLYQIAKIKEELNYQDAEVIQTYLAAYEVFPARAESLHGAVRFCRLHNKFHQAYLLGKHALTIPNQPGGLFVEQWIYNYGLLDEFSIVAYWAGYYRESFDACLKLLRDKQPPLAERDRIKKNAEFAIQKLNNPALRNLLPA